jgi:hypothetical protein
MFKFPFAWFVERPNLGPKGKIPVFSLDPAIIAPRLCRKFVDFLVVL